MTMKYGLYGLPCSGKTTLMSGLETPIIHGSYELNRMSSGRFSNLPDDEKAALRIKYAEELKSRKDSFLSDGHYSFLNEVVFTQSDGELYDVIIYLHCEPEIIKERLKNSSKNERFSSLSTDQIREWEDFEIENLRRECHDRNKDFYVVYDITSAKLQDFIDRIEQGFSSFTLAKDIVSSIRMRYPDSVELYICDGDKTIVNQDSFRLCTNNHVTHVFDGNFYTGFQSLQFNAETSDMWYNSSMLTDITINKTIYDIISDKPYFVISSGIPELWQKIALKFGFKNCIANTLISADTKYYIVKLLQKQGYTVFAYGDSKNDLYMLKQADKGYLYIGSYISRSLKGTDISGITLLYDKAPYIMSDTDKNIANDVAICKSNSGVNGSRLAASHFRLGRELGEVICNTVPNDNAAVIVLERGGRFFGDGLYTTFGGTFYSYDAKFNEIPEIHQNTVILVDSVINTGKTIINLITNLKKINPNIAIIIATNVIQEKALETLKDYKLFAIRVSTNSFVGSRQSMQSNGKGPDTADRLFNYIID